MSAHETTWNGGILISLPTASLQYAKSVFHKTCPKTNSFIFNQSKTYRWYYHYCLPNYDILLILAIHISFSWTTCKLYSSFIKHFPLQDHLYHKLVSYIIHFPEKNDPKDHFHWKMFRKKWRWTNFSRAWPFLPEKLVRGPIFPVEKMVRDHFSGTKFQWQDSYLWCKERLVRTKLKLRYTACHSFNIHSSRFTHGMTASDNWLDLVKYESWK